MLSNPIGMIILQSCNNYSICKYSLIESSIYLYEKKQIKLYSIKALAFCKILFLPCRGDQ